MFWKKGKQKPTILIEVNGQHIGTGQIGGYLLNLKRTDDFKNCHLGYIWKNGGKIGLRFIIFAWYPTLYQIQYFKDRCPAMVEQDIINSESKNHKFVEWNCSEKYKDFKEIKE